MTMTERTKKYQAVELRLNEIEKVVDRCLREHGSHLPTSRAAAIRAGAMRYAEGLLCLMTPEELSSLAPEFTMLRERLRGEVEKHTVSSLVNAAPHSSTLVN
jgi:hypothetical protein